MSTSGARRAEDTGRTALLVVGAVVTVALIWALRSVVMLVAFSTLLAYALDPLVSRVAGLRLPRGWRMPRALASAIVILALVAAAVWTAVVVTPQLFGEAASLLADLPERFQAVVQQFGQAASNSRYRDLVDPAVRQIQEALPSLQNWVVGWLGRMFQNVIQLAGLVVIPLLAFYLLAEREEVRASVMRFVPGDAEPHVAKIGRAVDRALASYVRGQAVVCLVSGGVMSIALSALGISHALLLGFLVAVAEILPFLGFWMAALAIGLVGLGESPMRAAMGIGAYVISNATIGLLVTPRVMGRHLKLHPFVITVSVLAGGELLGPPGVLLALPAAAIAQALVETYTGRSGARAQA